MTDEVPIVTPLSKAKIEEKAATILQHFDPDGYSGKRPIDIESFFEFDLKKFHGLQELKTGYRDLDKLVGSGVWGYTDAAKKVSYVHAALVDDMSQSGYRMFRSTVSHESAHCILHVLYLRSFISVSANGSLLYRKRKDIKAYIDPEWQAWALGGALLMPRHLVIKSYEQFESIYEMAERFNVNPAFVKNRLRILELQQR